MNRSLALQRLQMRLRRRSVSRRAPTIRRPRPSGLDRHRALHLGLHLGLSLAVGLSAAFLF